MKFHHTTSTEKSLLVEPCSLWGHSRFHVTKTETLVCSTIEAHEHTIQLLESSGSNLPNRAGDLRVTVLLYALVSTAFPIRDTLYKQLGNLHILCRESALQLSPWSDYSALDILRRAHCFPVTQKSSSPLLLWNVFLKQSMLHQNTASALHTLAAQMHVISQIPLPQIHYTEFYVCMFLVPKPNGTFRPILNIQVPAVGIHTNRSLSLPGSTLRPE